MRQMARGVNVASGFQPGPGCSQKVQAGHRPWLVADHSPAVPKEESLQFLTSPRTLRTWQHWCLLSLPHPFQQIQELTTIPRASWWHFWHLLSHWEGSGPRKDE